MVPSYPTSDAGLSSNVMYILKREINSIICGNIITHKFPLKNITQKKLIVLQKSSKVTNILIYIELWTLKASHKSRSRKNEK